MTQVKDLSQTRHQKYELVPPEGGWGYVVTLAVSFVFIVGLGPLVVFGIVFGPYLSTLGDEIGATTLITGLYNAVSLFTGLPANYLLKKYSYRKVGLLGATIYSIASFATLFFTSIPYMLVTFSVMQGFGFGLCVPSSLSAFHEYFVKRQNVMMAICQSIIGAVLLTWPALGFKLMANYGFRGTAAIFCAISLNMVLAMASLQPVRWHSTKREIAEMQTFLNTNEDNTLKSPDNKGEPAESDSLIKEHVPQEGDTSTNDKNSSRTNVQEIILSDEEEKKEGLWNTIVKQLDLALFKDPLYVNLAFGVAVSLSSDVTFLSIIPLLLDNFGFGHDEHGLIMTVYFTGDLVGRITLSVISGIFPIRNRYVVLTGAVISVIFRTAFTFNYSFMWTIIVAAILGSVRSCIQISFPLVFAEAYGPRFTSAFSLFMAVCGFTSLLAGVLSGFVKSLTNSNIMVVHLLTVFYGLCVVTWSIEIFLAKVVNKKVA